MSNIPLSIPVIENDEINAVVDVLKSGWLTHGPKNVEFEKMFADYHNVKHAIAMNSCTSALFLAVLANGITGEVIVPSFTFVASANAIVTAGATPVFAEINYNDSNINPDLIERMINKNTQAIMIVHYAGQCCNMDKIMQLARKHNLVVIEDSAETIGGTFAGLKSGSWGIGCYSFFPTKNFTTGEGGMLTTNDDNLAKKVRALVGHGIDKSSFAREQEGKSWYRAASYAGYNFRLSNILAAIGVEQMKKLDHMNKQRREHSFYLINKLKDVEEILLPYENDRCEHVYQMFTIKVRNQNKRYELIQHLRNDGIDASVHFDPPVHLHPAYKNSISNNVDLSTTELVANSIVTLPMFPQLKVEQLDRMVKSIQNYFTNG